ncbi:MAG: hypothetical protein NXI31_22610 [bacterium]|nr:hypothetical protein [bacterium]
MRASTTYLASGLLAGAVALVLFPIPAETLVSTPPEATAASPVPVVANAAQQNLDAARFVPNRGQWHADVRFGVLGSTAGWLHDDGFTVRFARHEHRASARELLSSGRAVTLGSVVRTRFSGTGSAPVADTQLPGRLNFLRGADESAWRTNVPVFERVTLPQVHPGIDVVFRPEHGCAFAYDLVLAPGADLDAFAAMCEGAERLYVAPTGRLHIVVPTPAGAIELTQEPPVAWQETAAGRRPVEVAFRALGDCRYGFVAAALDPELATVVDPGIAWSTYLGGGATDSVNDLAWVPGVGIWLTGWAGSMDFPTTVGAYRTTGQRDGFVARLDQNGAALQFATYFGGAGGDEARGVAIGPGLTPTIIGFTDSTDLPTTPNAYQATYGGAGPIAPLGDAFVTRLSAAGDSLLASTYLGGLFDEVGEAVAVDAQGRAYAVGSTASPNFPTTAGSWQPAIGGPLTGQTDAFVACLSADGTTASYSTYVGGTLNDQLLDVELDAATGEIVAGGWSVSADYPTTGLAYRTGSAGSVEMIALRLNASGSTPVFSTFLGGINEEMCNGIALAADGTLWLAGWTDSTNYPLTANAPQSTPGGEEDGALSQLSADGSTLLFSTLIGGSDFDQARAVAVDGSEVLVVGEAGPGLPLTNDAIQPNYAGGSLDAFVVHYTAGGANRNYASYAGGSLQDSFGDVAFANGLGILGGWSFSADFPVSNGALQGQLLGAEDGVVTVLDLLTDLPGGLAVTAPPPIEWQASEGGDAEVLAAEVTNTAGRQIAIESVRLFLAGRGNAMQQARDLRVWFDDPSTAEPRDRLVAGPLPVVVDDAEFDVQLADLWVPAGATVTLRVTVDFVGDTVGGTAELACAVVDRAAWTLRAFGAGTGPAVGVVGNGRTAGPVVYAGALPGDDDGDGRHTVLDLRSMCSRLGTTAGLVDTDGDQVISLADVDATREVVLGRATVTSVPGAATRGEWLALGGVFPRNATVEAVLGGRALPIGCATPGQLTMRVDPALPAGPHNLLVTVGGDTVVAATVIVQ